MENSEALGNEKILKKEDKLNYKKGFLNTRRGTLVLTPTELYFLFQKKKQFSIPTKEIISVNCKKAMGAGMDDMVVVYKNDSQERKAIIRHISFISASTLGAISLIGPPYFASWEQAINDARRGEPSSGGGIADLRELAALRDQGIITEEEFAAKKKRILDL